MPTQIMTSTDWMATIPLLRPLDEERQDWLAVRTSSKIRGKGEHIYFQEEESGSVFFIAAGRVKVGSFAADGRESIRYIANPGDMIGTLALGDEVFRSEFATALDDEVIVYQVNAVDLYALGRANPEFSNALVRCLANDLARSENRFEGVIFLDARTRIIETIRDMANGQGQVLAGGSVLISHALTHQDIAALTSTSRQTVTTVLNGLKDEGVINFDRRTILVHEMRLLK